MKRTGRTEEIAKRLKAVAEALGYEVEEQRSHVSESRYLYCCLPPLADDPDADPPPAVKVRVSAHDLPPSYKDADHDVDSGGNRPMGAHWAVVAAALARRVGKPVPAVARQALTRLARAAEQAAARERAIREETARIAAARQAFDDAVRRRFPEEWARAEAMPSGRDRREAKSRLRRRYERERAAAAA